MRLDKDIKALFAKGKGVFDVWVGFKFRKNDLNVTRFAVVVGTKVSKSAVVRNRLRRQVREAIRTRLSDIRPGYDIMVLVKKEAMGASFQELEKHVVSGLKKANIL
ncbi:ribonuclease P protein component [Candidatus Uhrbacteria bacterium RIFOXYC12_FULL_57_11]|nr:MAG: ribonuclease P protein component [Candidatus Uhrbacteria bacterium RIFOXYC12_FULL_57_11]